MPYPYGQTYTNPYLSAPYAPNYNVAPPVQPIYQQQANVTQNAPQTIMQAPQPPMQSNKVYVTSFEDAMNRYAMPNTLMVYRLQDESLEFEVTTDMSGKKTCRTYALKDNDTNTSTAKNPQYVTQEQLKEQIKPLYDKLDEYIKNMGGNNNA